MKYMVTVKFTRLNVKGKPEVSERSGVFESKTAKSAREEYMTRFWKNEPKCQQIHEIEVKAVK